LRCTWASTRPGSRIWGEWSVYVVPSGKSDGGSIEWKIDVIFPVRFDTTMVASVNLPAMTALEEVNTVIGCAGWLCGIGGGVAVWGAILTMGRLCALWEDRQRRFETRGEWRWIQRTARIRGTVPYLSIHVGHP